MCSYACVCVFLYICADVCLLKCECSGQRTPVFTFHLSKISSAHQGSYPASSWGSIPISTPIFHAGITDVSAARIPCHIEFHVDPGDSSSDPRAETLCPLCALPRPISFLEHSQVGHRTSAMLLARKPTASSQHRFSNGPNKAAS